MPPHRKFGSKLVKVPCSWAPVTDVILSSDPRWFFHSDGAVSPPAIAVAENPDSKPIASKNLFMMKSRLGGIEVSSLPPKHLHDQTALPSPGVLGLAHCAA